MRITNLRPLNEPLTASGAKTLARFNLAIAGDIILFDLQAVITPSARLEVYPPFHRRGRAAWFSPALRAELVKLYEGYKG
jgi:hypothetical protein